MGGLFFRWGGGLIFKWGGTPWGRHWFFWGGGFEKNCKMGGGAPPCSHAPPTMGNPVYLPHFCLTFADDLWYKPHSKVT